MAYWGQVGDGQSGMHSHAGAWERGEDGVRVVSGQVKEASVQYQVGCHSCDSMDSVESRACPPGYKQTEVGVIPDDWDVVELSEAVDFLDGLRKPVKAGDREKMRGDYRYYGASGVVDYVNDYLFDGSYILLGEDGENILSRNLPLAFRVNGKFWVNNHAHVMQPKDGFDIDYLTAFLESLDYSLLNSGTAQPKLNKQSCLSVKVAKPTKSEQTAIANALSDVDALITSLEKLITKKRAIKTAAMQQLLTGKKRLPPFDLTHTGYKQTELGEIPEDWEVVELGRVLSIRHGKSQKEVECENGKYPVLATGGEIGRTNIALYDKPSVLIGRKGTIDKPVYMDTPFWTVDTLFYSEVSQNFHAKFIYYKFCQIDWMSYNEASGVPSLNASTIENVLQAAPCDIKEQRAIADVLSDMDKDIKAFEQRLNKTQQLKQGMMQELLTGRTRLI
ncbi:MAG: restriction endonuclease subunit S [Methylobacter sp.]